MCNSEDSKYANPYKEMNFTKMMEHAVRVAGFSHDEEVEWRGGTDKASKDVVATLSEKSTALMQLVRELGLGEGAGTETEEDREKLSQMMKDLEGETGTCKRKRLFDIIKQERASTQGGSIDPAGNH